MIEMKFRAWNRIVRRFQFFDLPDLEKQKGKIQWQNIEITQFTGKRIKDVELYENDILRTPHFVNNKGKQEYQYHIVKRDEDYMMWKAVNVNNTDESLKINGNQQLFVYLRIEGAVEIIGNIYEHPFLLNTKNQ